MMLNWLQIVMLKYIKNFHVPDKENKSFYLLQNNMLGEALQMKALNISQHKVVLVPLGGTPQR